MPASAFPPTGFIGLGNMGWPMAANLVRGGVKVIAFDARPERAAAFGSETGAEIAGNLEDLAHACAVIITMLPDAHAVRAVVLGEAGRAGLVQELRAGAIIADMSSSDPRLYPEIKAALKEHGAVLVDAPVSGGVKGAEAATVTIMAGGEEAALDRLQPLFERMGERIFRTGPLGTGQAMKALNNLVSAAGLIATVEALLIGQRSGLDPALMNVILNVSTGRNNSTEKKIAPFVLSRRFDSGFALKLMTKDVATALGLAEATGIAAAQGERTLEIARAALTALGDGADHTAIARHLEELAGEDLRPASAGESS